MIKVKLNERSKYLQKLAKEYRADLIRRATSAEKHFMKLLIRYGIKFECQKIIFLTDKNRQIVKFYIADFVIRKTIVELDGEYHFTKEQRKKDRNRERDLQAKGYKILRIPNEVVFKEKEIAKYIELI